MSLTSETHDIRHLGASLDISTCLSLSPILCPLVSTGNNRYHEKVFMGYFQIFSALLSLRKMFYQFSLVRNALSPPICSLQTIHSAERLVAAQKSRDGFMSPSQSMEKQEHNPGRLHAPVSKTCPFSAIVISKHCRYSFCTQQCLELKVCVLKNPLWNRLDICRETNECW